MIVLSELYRGLMLTQNMTQEAALGKYEWVEPVPFTNETAAEAAELSIELCATGEIISKATSISPRRHALWEYHSLLGTISSLLPTGWLSRRTAGSSSPAKLERPLSKNGCFCPGCPTAA